MPYFLMNRHLKTRYGFDLYDAAAYSIINHSLARKRETPDALGPGARLSLTVDQVTAVRELSKGRKTPWAFDELMAEPDELPAPAAPAAADSSAPPAAPATGAAAPPAG
jgi:hypothetical protein